jgi:hypothetical protein
MLMMYVGCYSLHYRLLFLSYFYNAFDVFGMKDGVGVYNVNNYSET